MKINVAPLSSSALHLLDFTRGQKKKDTSKDGNVAQNNTLTLAIATKKVDNTVQRWRRRKMRYVMGLIGCISASDTGSSSVHVPPKWRQNRTIARQDSFVSIGSWLAFSHSPTNLNRSCGYAIRHENDADLTVFDDSTIHILSFHILYLPTWLFNRLYVIRT